MGLSKRVKEAINLMIFSGWSRKQAAETVGLADNSVYAALRNPEVLAYWNQQLEVLRTGERPRNIHTAIEIRDSDSLRETASGQKVRLEAAKMLEGDDGHRGTTVNVGIAVTPGYVIDLRPGDELERGKQLSHLIDIDPKSLSHKAEVAQDEEEDG